MFYFAASSILWFTLHRQQEDPNARVTLTWMREPFGVALFASDMAVTVAGTPVFLNDAKLTWPLLDPLQWRLTAVRAHTMLRGRHYVAAMPVVESTLSVLLTRTRALQAQALNISPMDTAVGTITVSLPRIDIVHRHLRADDGLPAESFNLNTGAIIVPLGANALQIDSVALGIGFSQAQPDDWHDRAAVAAWQADGGRVTITDGSLQAFDIVTALTGDVRLDNDLNLMGGLQLQVGGFERGYQRLGQLGLMDAQQYMLVGQVMRLLPDAGARTFTLPASLKGRTLHIGPAPVYKFKLPWADNH
jgi:hypothetical protein